MICLAVLDSGAHLYAWEWRQCLQTTWVQSMGEMGKGKPGDCSWKVVGKNVHQHGNRWSWSHRPLISNEYSDTWCCLSLVIDMP